MGVFGIVKILVCDVDGTLTDATIIYSDKDIESKAYSAKDGLVLKVLPHLSIEMIFMTGRKSEAVERRALDLGAKALQGVDDKAAVLRNVLTERGVEPEQCAYIGDDLNDYAAMKLCGFKACPADAVEEIRELSDYVSPYNGGHGAVRDICEHILKREGKYEELLAFYGALKDNI